MFPPVQQQRTFPGSLANKRVDGIGVRGVDEHPHRAVGVERIARLPLAGLRLQPCQEVISDALFEQQAGAGDTDLPLVIKNPGGGRAHGLVQVRTVGKDNVGAFAARLQPDALHVAFSRVLQQLLAGTGRAGKRQHLDLRMQCQRLARFVAVTAYHVQHAVRQARLFRQSGQPQGGER